VVHTFSTSTQVHHVQITSLSAKRNARVSTRELALQPIANGLAQPARHAPTASAAATARLSRSGQRRHAPTRTAQIHMVMIAVTMAIGVLIAVSMMTLPTSFPVPFAAPVVVAWRLT